MISPPSLLELQRAFAVAIVDGAAPALEPWIDARGIAPAARLRIYRHANLAIHVDALAVTFPALRRLLGEDCFDGLATRHAAFRGNRSGNLQDYGADFADFVVAQPETAAWPWLGEVARLEWLRQEVALAADEPPADAGSLIAALANTRDTLRLRPCVRVPSSAWAVLDLWRYAQEGSEEPPSPQRNPGSSDFECANSKALDDQRALLKSSSCLSGPAAIESRRNDEQKDSRPKLPQASQDVAIDPAIPQSVLLWREDGQVAMRTIAPAQAAFVRALRHEASLDLALAAAQLIDAQVTPEALLLPLLEHALLAA
jgi:Uncharacterized protein conserved in bacteria